MKEKQRTGAGRGATPEQLAEARRGVIVGLRRRFSAAWIAKNADDLLAAANVEYAEWVEENGAPARNPVGWLLQTVQWRATDQLRAEEARPVSTSLDELFYLADTGTPSPEQEALDRDRRERLGRALARLTDEERELLTLVYYGDLSIREAGRQIGWGKSAADRHHRAALDKVRALVGERGMIERGSIFAALKAAIDWIRRQLAEQGRRVGPAADHAGAAASSGGGRLLGACGVAVASVVCGLAASSIAPTGIGAAIEDARPAAGPPRPPALTGTGAELAPAQLLPSASAAPATREPEASSTTKATATPTTPERRRTSDQNPPEATGRQSTENFEIGATPGEGTPTPEASSTAPPSSSTSPEGSSGSSVGGSSSGSSQAPTPSAKEFGF